MLGVIKPLDVDTKAPGKLQ